MAVTCKHFYSRLLDVLNHRAKISVCCFTGPAVGCQQVALNSSDYAQTVSTIFSAI